MSICYKVDLESNKLEHIVVMWQLKRISMLNLWSTSYFDIFIYKIVKIWKFLFFALWMKNFDIFLYRTKMKLFHCMLKYFYISPTQNIQFFGTLFLLFYVLLVPSLTIFVSLRQKRWRLLSTINQQYRWIPRCVSAPLSFICPSIHHWPLYHLYMCYSPRLPQEITFYCNLPQEIIVYCKLQRTYVIIKGVIDCTHRNY